MTSTSLDATGQLIDEDAFGVVITAIAGEGAGSKAVLDEGGNLLGGSAPDGMLDVVRSDALSLMARERSATLAYEGFEVFFEVIAPKPRLFIFGAVHIAQELAQHASLLGYHVIVADPRPAFVTRDRFPEVDDLRVGWPGDVIDAGSFDARTFVVVLTHDRRFEDPLWPILLPSEVRYIGAMGSAKTTAARRERLIAAGFPPQQVDRIHGPIGLDIGSRSAGETAIAILGEMISVRYLHDQDVELTGRPARV
ncbi:MAG: XdhC family protein [Acidimicrobiia bacterium]